MVTADALHTHPTVCRAIQRSGRHYLLIAYHNQRSLHEGIAYLFSQPPDYWFPQPEATTVGSGHGHIAVLTLRASSELNTYLGDRWPDVQQVFQLRRTITRRGTRTTEVVYGLTSLPSNVALPLNNTIPDLLDCCGFANLLATFRTFAAYPDRALALIRPSP